MSFYATCRGARPQRGCCNGSFNRQTCCLNYFCRNRNSSNRNTLLIESLRPIRANNPTTFTTNLNLSSYINTAQQTVANNNNILLNSTVYQNLLSTLNPITGIVTVFDQGVYQITYQVVASAPSATTLSTILRVNGANVLGSTASANVNANDLMTMSGSTIVSLDNGATISLANIGPTNLNVNNITMTITKIN